MAESLKMYCEELVKKGSDCDITREAKSLCERAEKTERYFQQPNPEQYVAFDFEKVTFVLAAADDVVILKSSSNCIGKIVRDQHRGL